jgi:FkbM family methyltransferase
MKKIKNLVYHLIDIITLRRGIVRRINYSKVRFAPRWMRYFPSDYEKENYDVLRQNLKPGMDVIDIGAHIGLFTVVCSQLTKGKGKIVCFEPTPGTFQLLQQTIKLNHCENVTSVQAAVSDKVGTATFYISSDHEGNNSNSLVGNNPLHKMSGYDVKLETIDNIIHTYSLKPAIVKIDVEGAELDALKGGLSSFVKLKPRLILGLHPAAIKRKGDSLEAIWDLLMSVPYNIELDGNPITQYDFCKSELLFDVHCY